MLTILHANFFFYFLLFSLSAYAGPIESHFKNDLFLGAETLDLNLQSSSNPNNRIFEQFEHAAHLELRPALVLNYDEMIKLSLRPRMELARGKIPHESSAYVKTKKDLWLNEGYLTFAPKDFIQLSLGRQNYLWGPSEVVGPSNPFYSDLINRPSPLFLLRGVNLARLNLSYGSEYTLVTMVEMNSMDDADFEMRFPEKENNQHRVLMKGEYSSTNGEWSAGIIAGKRNQNPAQNIYGGLIMWTLNSAIQFYTDLRIDETPSSYIPYYVVGSRYTFENGLEWRNDFIYKKNALAILTPLNQDNLFYEKHYYSSLRKSLSAFSFFENPFIGARSLYSLSNHSGVVSGFFESGLNDYSTLTLYIGKAHGDHEGAYKQLFTWLAGAFLTLSY